VIWAISLKTFLILNNIMVKIISKVWENKANKQKLVTIPAKSKIKAGDYIEIKKVV
jgi:hypothetical protein